MFNKFNNDIDDGIKDYFSSLNGYKPLSKQEEQRLLREYKKHNDLDARNKLINSNLKYTCKLASYYRGYGIPYSDLISEANDALIESIDKYDLKQNVKLICYSKWWIIQRIKSTILKKNKMPYSELPTEDNSVNEDIDEIVNVDTNPQDNTFICNIEENENDNEQNNLLNDVCKLLSDREMDMVNMYFGRNYDKEFTLGEIGKKYGLSKERARQIIDKSIKKIRSEAILIEYKY